MRGSCEGRSAGLPRRPRRQPVGGRVLLDAAGNPLVLAAIILLFPVLQAIYGAHLPLFGDEAYYWAWSRHLRCPISITRR